MTTTLHTLNTSKSLKEISKKAYSQLESSHFPFADFDFLYALEESNCVGPHSGWLPLYLTVGTPEKLEAATYLYLKNNSYGEYIFDWAWANAYAEHGLPYFPKLVSSTPFTPATGPKLLFSENSDSKTYAKLLLNAAKEKMEEYGASSLHYLFITENEIKYFEEAGFLIRHSYQYHWHNNQYTNFDHFLSELKSRKRKQIISERSEINNRKIKIIQIEGEDIKSQHATLFFEIYLLTIQKMGAIAYLNLKFFQIVFEKMKNNIVLILAESEGITIAGALYYKKGDSLFGRYWGAKQEIKHLHFELCYYQPIEYAIKKKLTLFEAGAQGEHKLARGFLPALTYSAHLIRHPTFSNAISQFIEQEKREIKLLFEQENSHSPFKI